MLSAQLSTYYCSPALRRSRSCGGRNRTYASWFKARHHYQQRLPRIVSQRNGRDSNPPRRVGSPEQERPAGVEPAHPPWQGSRLPLHHGR